MSNKNEQIIQASVAIQAKREEVARASGELDQLLAGFKKLVSGGRIKVTATPAEDSEPGRRKPSRTKSKILRALRGKESLRFSEIEAKVGSSKSVVHGALKALIEEGSVRKLSFGVYGLTGK